MALFGKLSSLFGNKEGDSNQNNQALIIEVQINQNAAESMVDFSEFEDRVAQ